MELRGKAAVVTGASSGVGRATAIELARRGCDVLVNFNRSRAEADEVVAEIARLGAHGLSCQADVAEDAACRAMMAAAAEAFGRIDILVNSAGTTTFVAHADLERVTDDDWDRILDVNLKGTLVPSTGTASSPSTSRARSSAFARRFRGCRLPSRLRS